MQELHLEGNQLKKLPFTICTLGHLELLDVNNNHLHELPEDLGMLFNLKVLLVKNNPKLTRLPRSLHKAHRLCDIQVDSDVVTYPPREVTEQGCEEILKFICHSVDCNCYENRGDVACDVTDTPKNGNEPYHASYTTNIEVSSSCFVNISFIFTIFTSFSRCNVKIQNGFVTVSCAWSPAITCFMMAVCSTLIG